ncbi:MAG: CDP-diacylglycerol--glycerol-3-phosphate 3-phosphatidyltransferase [Acidiferrobacterales bacterium]|nr:CDP-diacylglycerol--glycerol-3-phosphate 3-phosphatidyltransferase [Acidiferrobacterales bacterium]
MVSARRSSGKYKIGHYAGRGEYAYNRFTMSFAQVPNIITIARLVMVPLLILLLKQQDYQAALILFVVAGLSDGLDGFIARRWHLESHLGGVLDPLADKLLMLSAYVSLALLGHIPFWLLLVVISRDFLIVAGYLIVTSQSGAVKMEASYFSKFNTAAQIALVAIVLAEQAAVLRVPLLSELMIYTVLVTTLVSGAHYYWSWIVKKRIEPLNPSDDN